MGCSVEQICEALDRTRLLSVDEVALLRRRWFSPDREDPLDVEQFRRWLVSNGFATEFQAGLLVRGQAESLFFNQYRLLERLAAGPQAGAYRASDAEGRPVVVRVLPPARARNPDTQARFEREVRRALSLSHPNIVRTLDRGEANGLLYVVLEHVEGETLEAAVQQRGRLAPLVTARIAAQALLALHYVHELGLVHGRLTPASLVLTAAAPGRQRKPATPVVKMLDVGIDPALFEEAAPGNGEALVPITGESILSAGPPAYTSPERLRDPRAGDIRSDLYSLGGVLYRCLAGQAPELGAGRRPLRELAPDVPEALVYIVEQLLAVDPAQRYPTPAQAAKALRVFLGSEDEAPSPSQEAERAEPVAPLPTSPPTRRPVEPALKTSVEALWDEVKPKDRDFVYMGIGMGLALLLGTALALLIGHTFWYFVFFLAGAGVGPLLERLIRWFRTKREDPDVPEA